MKKTEWEQAVKLDVNAVYTDNPYEILKLKKAAVLEPVNLYSESQIPNGQKLH